MVRITTNIQRTAFNTGVRDVRLVRTLVLPGGIVDVTPGDTRGRPRRAQRVSSGWLTRGCPTLA